MAPNEGNRGEPCVDDRPVLDAAPVGVMVHRDGIITYANAAFANITGRRREDLTGLPFSNLVAPEEVEKVAERYLRRIRGEAVPSEYETSCVLPDGTRRAVALEISLRDTDAIVVVRDVTDRVERRARRLALARLNASITAQDSPEGVYRAVREGLAAMGLATMLVVPAGNQTRVSWIHWPGDSLARFVSATGRDPRGMAGPTSRWIDQVLRDGEAYADDAPDAIATFVGEAGGRIAHALAVESRLVRAVATRIAVDGEVVGVLVASGDWLSEDDLAAIHVLGEQVAASLQNAKVLSTARRRLRDLESLHQFARKVLAATTEEPRALAAAACEAIARATDARWAAAYLVTERDALARVASWSAGGEAPGPAEIPLAGRPCLQTVLAGEVSVPLADTCTDPRSPVVGSEGVQHGSAVMIPVRSKRGSLGVVTVAGVPGQTLADGDVAVAEAMVTLLGLGLENAELLAEVRRRLQEISLVYDVGRTVAGSLDLQRVLDEGCEAIRRLLDASNVFVMLHDASVGELRGAAGTSGVAKDFVGARQALSGTGLAAEAVRQRCALVSEDAASDPRVNQVLRARYGEASVLVVPLLRRDEPVGVVVVDECRRIRRFTDAEIERAVVICNQLAVAVDNARLYDETRRSYGELAEAQARLVQRERLAALGELAAVIAHEVRNPLGVIFNSLGALGRLISLYPGTDEAVLIAILQEEAERLNHIVGDLLDFARPVRPAVSPERLERVLDDALNAARAGHDGSGVTVVRDIPADLAPVAMDARLMRQAMLNLVDNALHSMAKGGTLTVRARTEGPWAQIELADTGEGMTSEVVRKIFEPFYTTKAKGTGLGLAVVKRITEGHGGEVTVDSSPGEGARFTIRLPMDPGQLDG